jgi:hypothetical protein
MAFTIDRPALLSSAGVLMVIACGFSGYLIRQHLRYFTIPHAQSKIIGIIYMVPIYSFDSFLGLVCPRQALYINMFRD